MADPTVTFHWWQRWWWHLLFDGLLGSTAAYFAYQFLTNRAWDTESHVSWYIALLVSMGVHGLGLGLYSFRQIWRKRFGSGIFILLYALSLLALALVFLGVLLMVGMG